jgi:hypothetical protein
MPTLAKKPKKTTKPHGLEAAGQELPRRVLRRTVAPMDLDPALIDPSPYQPRVDFPATEIQTLADSLRMEGQPSRSRRSGR